MSAAGVVAVEPSERVEAGLALVRPALSSLQGLAFEGPADAEPPADAPRPRRWPRPQGRDTFDPFPLTATDYRQPDRGRGDPRGTRVPRESRRPWELSRSPRRRTACCRRTSHRRKTRSSGAPHGVEGDLTTAVSSGRDGHPQSGRSPHLRVAADRESCEGSTAICHRGVAGLLLPEAIAERRRGHPCDHHPCGGRGGCTFAGWVLGVLDGMTWGSCLPDPPTTTHYAEAAPGEEERDLREDVVARERGLP